ncbi:MAG: Sir2 family NAD-dependent protein deacetylase [Acidimicrobiia bacterium]|nr:Sir2 family NAD-dependent protein deacetylase [Acidimicrobiia bacterium]
MSTVEEVAGWVDEARAVVVLTGAGISTDSGIADFRGPNGVWTKDPKAERMAHISVYMDDPDVRKRSWRNRVEHPAWQAQPNRGHAAIVELERRGKLHTLITQNVDGLHQAAGSDPDLVVEMHGTVHEVMCMACDERAPMERALARVRAGEEDPPCRSCGGILKSATVSFGQNLDPNDIERAERAALECDLMLCVGSTLTVYPVAEVPYVASASGAKVVVINAEPTAFDERADAVLRGQIGDLLPKVVNG